MKQTTKRIIGTALSLVMAVGSVPAAFAANDEYRDVSENAWYADAVQSMKDSGLMIGTGENEFSPDGSFTRAQIATVLYRMAGSPAVSGEDSFTDTEPGKWYSDAILWAEQNGIVKGIGNNQFAPNAATTQEQVITMLQRDYQNRPDHALAVGDGASSIEEDAVQWAKEFGIIQDSEDYTFSAEDDATRAQVAALVARYMDEIADTDGGWEVNAGALSLEQNPQVKAAFEKATEMLLGAEYEPIAYLGSQVVAGSNYFILCRITPVVPDAVPEYAVVTVYEDLEGNAEIAEASELPIHAEADVAGGWTLNTGDVALDANKDVKAAFEKATEMLLGADYEPIAYMANQVVAGRNYMILCRITPVVPDAVPSFALVTVYAALDGTAELLEVKDITMTGQSDSVETEKVQIPDPWADYDSYQAAANAAGFAFGAPERMEGYNAPTYRVLSGGELFEITYESEGKELLLRKAPGSEDISGDYNEYSQVKKNEATGATFKGEAGKVTLAVWTAGEYTYSVGAYGSGLAETDMQALVLDLMARNK